MKAKIDVERFVASLCKWSTRHNEGILYDDILCALSDQDLAYDYVAHKIVPVITQPSEDELVGMGGIWTDQLAHLYCQRDNLNQMIEEYGDRTASNILQNIEQKIKYWEERK